MATMEQGMGDKRNQESAFEPLQRIDPGEALESIESFARENPHVAIAAACAVGFVLGGGLHPRILGAGALLLARKYFGDAVDQGLEGFVRGRYSEDH